MYSTEIPPLCRAHTSVEAILIAMSSSYMATFLRQSHPQNIADANWSDIRLLYHRVKSSTLEGQYWPNDSALVLFPLALGVTDMVSCNKCPCCLILHQVLARTCRYCQ